VDWKRKEEEVQKIVKEYEKTPEEIWKAICDSKGVEWEKDKKFMHMIILMGEFEQLS